MFWCHGQGLWSTDYGINILTLNDPKPTTRQLALIDKIHILMQSIGPQSSSIGTGIVDDGFQVPQMGARQFPKSHVSKNLRVGQIYLTEVYASVVSLYLFPSPSTSFRLRPLSSGHHRASFWWWPLGPFSITFIPKQSVVFSYCSFYYIYDTCFPLILSCSHSTLILT